MVVLLADAAKGVFPVLVASWSGASSWVALAAGVAAMVGHWYPVFLRFRGGAGLATAIGVGYGLLPLAAVLASPPALALLYFKHSTGLASGLGFVVFFAIAMILKTSVPLALVIALLPALALARERLLPTPGTKRQG